jgi:hypothetical protein
MPAVRTRSVDIRSITVGHVHAEPGDPAKVVAMHAWLVADRSRELPPIAVTRKHDGTFRIHDGRHRFVSYVLAERPTIPIVELPT